MELTFPISLSEKGAFVAAAPAELNLV